MRFLRKFSLLCLLIKLYSCNEKIESFSIQQKEICNYFYLHTDSVLENGRQRYFYRPEIRDSFIENSFLKKYGQRFDYFLIEEVKKFFSDTAYKNSNKQAAFCEQLKSEKFYTNLSLLSTNTPAKTIFTKDEMMLVASRFFYCDTVLKKGNKIGVGWHICAGINGLDEINSNRDLTALEAFCFEAIYKALTKRRKPVFFKKFTFYINETNKKEKPFYTDDKNHLKKVKEQCYTLMQNDMALQESLLDYYEEHKQTFGFEIK